MLSVQRPIHKLEFGTQPLYQDALMRDPLLLLDQQQRRTILSAPTPFRTDISNRRPGLPSMSKNNRYRTATLLLELEARLAPGIHSEQLPLTGPKSSALYQSS